MELAVPGLKWCVYRLKKWKGMKVAWTRDPFKVEKKFIRNVYFQVESRASNARSSALWSLHDFC